MIISKSVPKLIIPVFVIIETNSKPTATSKWGSFPHFASNIEQKSSENLRFSDDFRENRS